MKIIHSVLTTLETKKSIFLTLLLSAILFWIGLGVGDNMSDSRFWVQSTWISIKLEWFFILLYVIANQKFLSLKTLWKNYSFITLVASLWMSTVLLSYFTTSLYSWQNPLALMRLIETLTHFLFFLALWDFFTRYSVNYRMIFTAIILSTLIVMAYFIYIHFAFPGLEAEKHVFSMRSDQLVLNTHLHRIGYQVEAAIAFSTVFLFSKNYKYSALALIGILFVFLLWLGGRAAILGTLLTLLICLWYFRKQIQSKMFIGFGVATFVLIGISIYFQLLNLDYFTHALKKTFQAGSLDHLLTGRIEVWSLALQELNGHWLVGTGPQSYFFYLDRHADVIHAHNFILQMLGEWGIIGTGLFSILLYRAVKFGLLQDHQEEKTKPYHFTAGLVLLSLSVTGLFGGTYFFVQTSLYLTVTFALWASPSVLK